MSNKIQEQKTNVDSQKQVEDLIAKTSINKYDPY